MKLAKKITELRKKNAWSQEELAEKLNVSRQAVSKWEAGQSTPELDKIIGMSELFGVSTDYLLKDGAEEASLPTPEPAADDNVNTEAPLRTVELSEAQEYLKIKRSAALQIPLGAALCIISCIPLLLMLALSKLSLFGIEEASASAIGICAIFPFVAIGAIIIVRASLSSSKFEFIEGKAFALTDEASFFVSQELSSYRRTNISLICTGIGVCVTSPIPVIVAAFSDNGAFVLLAVCLTLLLVAVGAFILVQTSIIHGGMEAILKDGDYAEDVEKRNPTLAIIERLFWQIITAAYFIWSFATGDWSITWVIWPIAGIVFACIELIFKLAEKPKKE